MKVERDLTNDSEREGPAEGAKVDRASTSHGGQSGSEDTTRSAGYVVDMQAANDRPPGPPIAGDPRLLQGAEHSAPSRQPPGVRASRGSEKPNATAGAEDAVRSAQARQAQASERLMAEMAKSSAGEGPATDRFFDAVESAMKPAEEYVRSLAWLRDVLRGRLQR